MIAFTLSIVTTRATDTALTWYLRSYQDEDTHRAGALAADGTVRAICGLTFRPVAHPLDGVPACLSSPPDALQVWPGLSAWRCTVSDQHRRCFDRLAATVVLRQVIVLAEQSIGLTDAELRARLVALTEVAW